MSKIAIFGHEIKQGESYSINLDLKNPDGSPFNTAGYTGVSNIEALDGTIAPHLHSQIYNRCGFEYNAAQNIQQRAVGIPSKMLSEAIQSLRREKREERREKREERSLRCLVERR